MQDQDRINLDLSHLFRKESGKMVAVLVKIFGSQHLELAEDVVQDALISALDTWKIKGIPDNPRAWLYRTARNKAIDIVRRERHNVSFDFSDPQYQLLTSEYTMKNTMDEFWKEDEIKDDFLAMMFGCCQPEIKAESQVTFMLKTLCGFSTKEIAKAFITTEDIISKRLYRTKEYFRSSGKRPEVPKNEELNSRIYAVLDTIYLMFNEGYNSTNDDQLIRQDIISQAMMLCKSLTEHKKPVYPNHMH